MARDAFCSYVPRFLTECIAETAEVVNQKLGENFAANSTIYQSLTKDVAIKYPVTSFASDCRLLSSSLLVTALLFADIVGF